MEAKLTARTVATLKPSDKPYEVCDTELKGFLLRVQPSGVMTYYFAYKAENGKRNRYRIGRKGTISPVQARDAAELKAGEVALGKDVQAERKKIRHAEKLSKMATLEGFLDHKYGPWVLVERRTGKTTLQRIKAMFTGFLKSPMGELTEWDITKWRSAQKKKGKADSSINREVAALKAVLSKAVEWGVIEIHPLAKVKMARIDKSGVVRYLSDDEEISLRKALDQREAGLCEGRTKGNMWRADRGYPLYADMTQKNFADHIKPMTLLSLNTGMRRGEVFSLTWDAVNLQQAMLTVFGQTAKSSQTRHIPLNEEALAVLKNWQADSGKVSGLVFPNRKGVRFDNIKGAWGNVLKLAGIQNFRWHDLRHTFASKLVMAGVDLNTVRELLGHSDIKMTLCYAHLAPEHKAAAVALLAKPVSRKKESRDTA